MLNGNMKTDKNIKLVEIQVTQGARQDAMKHSVHRNKKKYYRKSKHKNKDNE